MPTDLRKAQLGLETVNGGAAGTAVAPTVILSGTPSNRDISGYKQIPENVNSMQDFADTYQAFKKGQMMLPGLGVSFEQLPYILAASIRGKVNGVQDGSGSGYIYEFTVLNSAEDIRVIAATIGFTASTKKIDDSGNGLAFVKTGDTIEVSGSGSNDGIYTVATGNVAGEIVVTESLTDEGASATVEVRIIPANYTIRSGNDIQAYEGKYGYVERWLIGAGDNALSNALLFVSDWRIQSWAQASFADLDAVAVEWALFSRAKMYIDAVSGTMGATLKERILAEFELLFDSGIRGIQTADGVSSYSFSEFSKKPVIECDFVLNQYADITTEILNWQNNTPRLIEIKIEGSDLDTAGTTYSKKTIRIQLPGFWASMPEQIGVRGQERIVGTFKAGYNPTAGIGVNIIVVNELSSLT